MANHPKESDSQAEASGMRRPIRILSGMLLTGSLGGMWGCAYNQPLRTAEHRTPAAKGSPVAQSGAAATAAVKSPAAVATAKPSTSATSGSSAELRAAAAEQSKDWATAQVALQEAIQANPQTPSLHHRAAVASTQLRDWPAADTHFREALRLNPNNATLLSDIGFAYFTRGEYAQAEQMLQRACGLAPTDRRAARNLAIAVAHQGRFDEAQKRFEKLYPVSQAHEEIAKIHLKRGDVSAAENSLERALKADPKLATARTQLDKLQQQASLLPPRPAEADESIHAPGPMEPIRPAPKAVVAEVAAPVPVVIEATSEPLPPLPPVDAAPAPQSVALLQQPVDETPARISLADSPEANGDGWTPLPASVESPTEIAVPLVAPISSPAVGTDDFFAYCPVELRQSRRLIVGDTSLQVQFNGKMYSFSSTEARDEFLADPELYVPAANGSDIVEFKATHAIVDGGLSYATWYKDQLFLFASRDNLNRFKADPRAFVSFE